MWFSCFLFFHWKLKMLKVLGILFSLYFAVILVKHSHAGVKAAESPSREGKTFETWELLCFCALNLLELFRTKNRIAPPAQFLVINKVVFFSDNQDFQTIIYRAKPFFFFKKFCWSSNCKSVYGLQYITS